MDEIKSADSLEVASERMDRAIARLEKNISLLGEKGRVISDLQGEVERLSKQNNVLASDYERSSTREKNLDQSADEVSRRLVTAMETIKTVLVK